MIQQCWINFTGRWERKPRQDSTIACWQRSRLSGAGLDFSCDHCRATWWVCYHPDPLSPGNVSPPQPISTGDRQLGAWGGTVCAWYLVKKPSLYDPVDSATLPGARTGNL